MRYRIRGGPVVYKCFVFVLKPRTFKILYNVLDLTFKESNPAYLSEKRPFKCVVRPRKYLIDRFLWTCSLIKRAILTWELQKNLCKNRAKKTRYWDAKFLPEFLSLLRSQPGCYLLSIIVCNTTKIVRSRLKLI